MTNAGKTHTIQGTNKDMGIFPRLVATVLNKANELVQPELKLSILEIYQEKLFDLLLSTANKKEKLSINQY